ncbi:hypothetical protein [Streptomyces roseoverticillatus]|uniref:Uncharacterized protein n=1 Tax=Streptomyces roseoverticillatus TaxID=66429 RepID=A0ABV3J4C4_9ACTN
MLDEALGRGLRPDDPPDAELDGWDLFGAVAARRARGAGAGADVGRACGAGAG